MIPISKPYIGEAEKQAVLEVLESGMLVQSSRTALFEERFAKTCSVEHAVAVASGTAALHIALLAHGIGPGDEVITSPFTFMASISSILFVGAKPVFVDIEADTFNINPDEIEAAITPHTKAILPVHLFGYPCSMDSILDLADRYDLMVIEDAAQAVGAAYHGKPTGSFGTGCFSLYATKNIMAGEGGMITTNDDEVAAKAKMIRNHGMQRRYYHDMLGYNYRMTDINAALGLVQLDRLESFTEKRTENARRFNQSIKSVVTPQVREGYKHVWHQYTIRVNSGRDRDAAVAQLNQAGVGTGIFYPVPAYRQPPVLNLGYEGFSLPTTEKAVSEVISIPVHPQLSDADVEMIIHEVNKL